MEINGGNWSGALGYPFDHARTESSGRAGRSRHG